MTDHNYYQKVAITLAMVTTTILSVLVVLFAARIFLLFFVSILISIPLHSGGKIIERYTPLNKKFGAMLTAILFLLALVSIGTFIYPQLAQRTAQFVETTQEAIEEIEQIFSQTEWGQTILQRVPSTDLLSLAPDPFHALASVFTNVISPVFTVIVLFIVAIMLAIQPELYQNLFIKALPDEVQPKAQEFFQFTNTALQYWLLARVTSMLAIGILTWLGLLVLNVPLPVTLAVIAGLLSFIPNIGPLLSFIPAGLVSLTEDPRLFFYVMILYIVLQTIESYGITPYVEERTVFLPPALTIFVQLLLTLLVGVIGAMVAAPLLVVGIVVIKLIYYPYVLNK